MYRRGAIYSLQVTDVSGGFIHVMGPFASPIGTAQGTLQIDIGAPLEHCTGAASCSASVSTHLTKRVSYSDACTQE